MEIQKPIFIIGAARSGTTILYNLLSLYPEVCWLSTLTERFPKFHKLALLHRILDIPFIASKIRKSTVESRGFYLFRPREGVNIYRFCGFEDSRKTTENNLTKEMEIRFKEIIKGHLRLTGKKRFLNKRTANTQRIRLINRMFPDAYYIHVIRDGRAVARSLLCSEWWDKLDIWWLGHTPSEWEAMDKEPIELCALHWKQNVEEILKNKYLFEDRYIEVRYGELVKETKDTIRIIANFCELNNSKKCEELIPETLPNMNYKWGKELTEHQKIILDRCVGQFLKELGY